MLFVKKLKEINKIWDEMSAAVQLFHAKRY